MVNIDKRINKDIYSTSEVKTNKVWIDGKKIYRKVLHYDTYNIKSGDNNFPIELTNIKNMIDLKVNFIHNNRLYTYWDSQKTTVYILSNNTLNINYNSALSTTDYNITLEYTKTS